MQVCRAGQKPGDTCPVIRRQKFYTCKLYHKDLRGTCQAAGIFLPKFLKKQVTFAAFSFKLGIEAAPRLAAREMIESEWKKGRAF